MNAKREKQAAEKKSFFVIFKEDCFCDTYVLVPHSWSPSGCAWEKWDIEKSGEIVKRARRFADVGDALTAAAEADLDSYWIDEVEATEGGIHFVRRAFATVTVTDEKTVEDELERAYSLMKQAMQALDEVTKMIQRKS